MTDLKVHIGDSAAAFGSRFVDAWHRAEQGERVNERHLSFDSSRPWRASLLRSGSHFFVTFIKTRRRA